MSRNKFDLPLLLITYAYVTYQDLRGISEFHGTTVIAVKAPPETRLEVPKPEEVSLLLINCHFLVLCQFLAAKINTDYF